MQTSDIDYLRRAIQLAQEAQQKGNLPIGACITLDGNIIAEGKNSIWFPKYRPNRHAEIEALDAVPVDLWNRAVDMTLYTTLEPCLMCMGTILVHHIGRVVFGAKDIHGGAMCVVGHMPTAFEILFQSTQWIGPALPEKCDVLSKTVIAMALLHRKKKERDSSIWDLIG